MLKESEMRQYRLSFIVQYSKVRFLGIISLAVNIIDRGGYSIL